MLLRALALGLLARAVGLSPPPALRPGYAVVALSAAAPMAPSTLPSRVRELWPERFPTPTAAKKAVRRRLVCVDGRVGRCDDVVASAEIALLGRVEAGPAPGEGRRGRAGGLRVCHEDEELAVVYKPEGVDVSSLASSLRPSRSADRRPLWRPQHCHRLDKPTSGLVVVAKTGDALTNLSAAFAARLVRKRYRAVVAGRLGRVGAPRAAVCLPLSGQSARTEWAAVSHHPSAAYGHVTLVDLLPRTGRTHQLRRHMALLGHPIVGDAKYFRRHWRGAAREERGEEAVQGQGPEAWSRSAEGEASGEASGAIGAEAGEAAALCLSSVEVEVAHPRSGAPVCVRVEQPAAWGRLLGGGGGGTSS